MQAIAVIDSLGWRISGTDIGSPGIAAGPDGSLHLAYYLGEGSGVGCRVIMYTSEAVPVVLIHGIMGSSASFGGSTAPNLKSLLEAEGRTVKYFSYPSAWLGDWQVSIENLAHRLDDSLQAWSERESLPVADVGVDIVGHSMGGLIARYYVSHPLEFEFADKVRKLVTLGTPSHGAAGAVWSNLLPGATQGIEMQFGSDFLWDLGTGTDILCVVGAEDNYTKPHDGVVLLPSASLADLGVPVCFVPCPHSGTGGIANIRDTSHYSFRALKPFLSGTIPPSNEGSVAGLTEGMLTIGLRDPNGNRVRVGTIPFTGLPRVWWRPNPTLYWGWPWGWFLGWGVNLQSGRYYGTGADAGSYTIRVYPAGGYTPVIDYPVTIIPRQAKTLLLTVYPADETSHKHIEPGNTQPVTFDNTGVTVDFSTGPGGDVSAYRFNSALPVEACTTLAHYCDITTDMPDDSFSATITFSYTDEEVREAGLTENVLTIASCDSSWHPLATAVDTVANTVSAPITALATVFAIGAFGPGSIERGVSQFNPRYDSTTLAAHPDPCNATTNIEYCLSKEGHVALQIYDVGGQLVKTLADEKCRQGAHRLRWTGTDMRGTEVPAGIYLCRLETDQGILTRKLTLLR
ncbi:MAG: hypothetical protein NTX53_07975 [candidate division WOR-3 bacterium]|nr:hypothetical protein [candidate division WOR-3 bacterium]